MTDFFKDYGGLISLIMLILGWFVLLNSTKYITSRNEAKSYINDLTSLLENAFKESIEFWSVFSAKTVEERNTFYKTNDLKIRQIRDYKKLLENYDIIILNSHKLKKIKDNLTLSPETHIIEDPIKLKSYILKKTSMAHREGSKYIHSIHQAFLDKYPPTRKPLIENLFKLNYVTGLLYGAITMVIYFLTGKAILG
ncbi:hypothetical protein [Thalassotalea sp. PLHSN55]|uniref:hypothetical protein n=1 Tax=Thalassotalea sp. PLHSN55 TaxID=3435888 RepID=UPI003F83BA38